MCLSLFYAAEVRPFTSVEILVHQLFLNKVVRYLVWSEHKIGIQDIENTYTNELFFSWCGLRSAKNYIYSRTWQYLGHLGRCSDDRIELLMLGARLKLPREELCHSSSVRVFSVNGTRRDSQTSSKAFLKTKNGARQFARTREKGC